MREKRSTDKGSCWPSSGHQCGRVKWSESSESHKASPGPVPLQAYNPNPDQVRQACLFEKSPLPWVESYRYLLSVSQHPLLLAAYGKAAPASQPVGIHGAFRVCNLCVVLCCLHDPHCLAPWALKDNLNEVWFLGPSEGLSQFVFL